MRQSWHEDALASAAKNEVAKSVPPSLPRVSFPRPSPMDIPVESMKASLRSHHDSGDQTSEIVS
jgi:hypothetical protein